MSFAIKIEKHLGRKIDFRSEVLLQDDGAGVYIKEWNVDEEQPTDDELNEIDVTKEIALKAVLRKRVIEYPSIQDVTVALAEKAEGDSTMWEEITAKRAKVKADYPKP